MKVKQHYYYYLLVLLNFTKVILEKGYYREEVGIVFSNCKYPWKTEATDCTTNN